MIRTLYALTIFATAVSVAAMAAPPQTAARSAPPIQSKAPSPPAGKLAVEKAAAEKAAAEKAAAEKAGAEKAAAEKTADKTAAVKASSNAPAASGQSEVQSFDDWAVRCFPTKSTSPCDMLFAEVRKGTKQRVTSVSIAYIPSRKQYVMQVAVPYGIALAEGLVIAAGTYKTDKLVFRRCDSTGCFVEMEVVEDLITALKTAADGSLAVVGDDGRPVTFALPLKGFGPAQQAMVALATEKAVAPVEASPH